MLGRLLYGSRPLAEHTPNNATPDALRSMPCP